MAEQGSRRWIKGVVWAGGTLVALVLLLALLNSTTLPLQLGRGFTRIIEQRTGWHIQLQGARFVGPTRLRLEGVDFIPPGGVVQRGSVPQVYISFNPLRLFLSGDSEEIGLGRIDLIRPHVRVEADAWKLDRSSWGGLPPLSAGSDEKGAAGENHWGVGVRIVDGVVEELVSGGARHTLWKLDGRFQLTTDVRRGVRLLELDLSQTGGGVVLHARAEERDAHPIVTWRLKGPADYFQDMIDVFPWEISGALEAEGVLLMDGSMGGEAQFSVKEGDMLWGERGSADWVPFDRLDFAVDFGETLNVERLMITKGASVVKAQGGIRLGMKTADGDPHVELSVVGEGLSLPEDVPVLAEYGLSGRADFSGVLTGDPGDLELSGRLSIEDGTVWHRPVTRGEGVIRVRAGYFSFGQALLEQGTARYKVHGEVVTEEDPTRIHVELNAKEGRIEEILAAVGVTVEARGEFDGDITFDGAPGKVEIEGDVTTRDVHLMGQPFDTVSGGFAWSPTGLRLNGVQATLAEGTARGSGRRVGDDLDFDLSLDRWPVDPGVDSPLSLNDDVSGWVSYSGRIDGTLSSPTLAGDVTDGTLRMGRLSLQNVRGPITMTLDTLTLSGVQVVSVGRGEYSVTGRIEPWRGENPLLDIDVEVAGASLSGLLQEGGLTLPALLFDGQVAGSIELTGPADGPQAHFDLTLSDELGVGSPIRLRFQIDDGRLKLGGLGGLGVLKSAL